MVVVVECEEQKIGWGGVLRCQTDNRVQDVWYQSGVNVVWAGRLWGLLGGEDAAVVVEVGVDARVDIAVKVVGY